jgi:acetylornithine deacetylase/succinyl-diaminopimelate desuccinylase-like protein
LIKDILADLAAYKKATERLADPQLGRADITLTEIKGDGSTGSVAEPHRILVDIRMLPSQSPAQIHGDISRLVGTRGKVVPLFAGLGIDSNPADPYIQKFQESLKRQGLPADLIALPCPSDCSQLRGQGPCLVWGPGNPDQAHRQEEYIELSQIKAACRVLTDFLTS